MLTRHSYKSEKIKCRTSTISLPSLKRISNSFSEICFSCSYPQFFKFPCLPMKIETKIFRTTFALNVQISIHNDTRPTQCRKIYFPKCCPWRRLSNYQPKSTNYSPQNQGNFKSRRIPIGVF